MALVIVLRFQLLNWLTKDGVPWVPEDIFFFIDTDGSRRSRVNEEKNNLWSQEYSGILRTESSIP